MLSCSDVSDTFATSWTVAHQTPLSMEFSKQECWSELPFSTPEDLLDSGIELESPASAGGFFTTEPSEQPIYKVYGEMQKGKLCVSAKLLQSYLTLCNPMDCSPPGSSVHGILQQEYWSGLPCPSPGKLPNPGIEPTSPALAGRSFGASATWEAQLLSHKKEQNNVMCSNVDVPKDDHTK